MGLNKEQRKSEQHWWITDFVEDAIIEANPNVDWTKVNVVKMVEKHSDEIMKTLTDVAKKIAEKEL